MKVVDSVFLPHVTHDVGVEMTVAAHAGHNNLFSLLTANSPLQDYNITCGFEDVLMDFHRKQNR